MHRKDHASFTSASAEADPVEAVEGDETEREQAPPPRRSPSSVATIPTHALTLPFACGLVSMGNPSFFNSVVQSLATLDTLRVCLEARTASILRDEALADSPHSDVPPGVAARHAVTLALRSTLADLPYPEYGTRPCL